MSKVFPKDKRKRSRTSSGEGNNSLVSSASFSRWFSGASSSSNGSAPAEPSDSQDEPSESPAQPPPSKRVCTPSTTSKFTKNYGLNDSFMKNVTQRVTGLLPATITKWFSSPSSANGSSPQADSTDSSTEDEAPEPPPQPPPGRRPGYTVIASKHSSNYVINDVISTPESGPLDLSEVTEPSSYSVVQSLPSRATFRRESNIVATPLRSEETEKGDRESKIFSPQHTVSQIGRSVEKKRKSLFGNKSPEPTDVSLEAPVKTLPHPIKDREPCFKPSLLGSPFYPGRTMYGGASSSLYLNQPNIKQHKTAVVQEANDTDVSISSATRRVMDLLEHYSSPLIEAKRIPLYTTASPDRSTKNKSIAPYKRQELSVAQPGVASMLRLKQRHKLQNSMADVRQIIASQSSTCPYPPPSPVISEKDNFTSKIKSRVTASRPKRGDAIDEMPPPFELPSGGLYLDNTNLPKFSFSTPLPSQSSTNFRSSKPQTVVSKITENSNLTNLTSDSFRFANPVNLSSINSNNEEESKQFSFGSPDRNVDARKVTVISFVGGKDSNPDGWKCGDCLVMNKSQAERCICCGSARTVSSPVPSKCSICKLGDKQENNNKCVNCDKVAAKNISGTLVASDLKWICADCWVSNDETAVKCVCCGRIKPYRDMVAATPNVPNTDTAAEWRCKDCLITNKKDVDKCAACGGLKPGATKEPASSINANAFKLPATSLNSLNTTSNKTSEWRCANCCVNNKSEIQKCVACGADKPGPKSELTVLATKQNNLQETAKPQKAKWECQSCLVKNENDALKCVCCEEAKPGTIKESDKKMFNFGVTPNISFKFGIDPVKQPEVAKPAETKTLVNVIKKSESETNNNSLTNTPTFSFGIPKKSEANTSSNDKPNVQFTFGIPKQQTDTVDVAKTDCNTSLDTRKPSSENNDKEQVVPKHPTSESAKSTFGTFTLTQDTSNSIANPPSSSPSLLTHHSTQDVNNKPLVMPATKAESQPSFTFTAGAGIKMLLPPASSSAAVSSVMTPVTTSSLFSKLEAPASTTASMFSMSTTGTSVSTGTPASAPVFGFGTAAATLAPATTEAKPSFTFTFGTNKTETPMLKPPPAFGATESNNNTNFSLPASTSLVPNVTSASTMPTNNSLPNSNIFGSNLPKTNDMFMSPTNATAAPGMFTVPSSTDNTLTKPATFSFGSSPFNATSTQAPAFGNSAPTNATPAFGVSTATNASSAFGVNATPNSTPAFGVSATPNATPAFGAGSTSNASAPFGSNINANTASAFGAPSGNLPSFGAQAAAVIFGGSQPVAPQPAPAFGSAVQSPFGLPSQNSNNQSSLFSSPTPSTLFGGPTTTPSANLFGSPTTNPAPFGSGQPTFVAPSAPPPAFGPPTGTPTFGSHVVDATPAFGALNTSISSFKAPAQTPAPAFNFGAPQQSPGVFGFGQQQQQQPGIYNFGAAAASSPVQFNMGTGPSAGGPPNTAVRKFRKATRRSATPR